jgi:hypothetical protein
MAGGQAPAFLIWQVTKLALIETLRAVSEGKVRRERFDPTCNRL